MAEVVKGKLVWTPDKKVRKVVYPTKKGGMSPPTSFDLQELAPALRTRTEDEIEIELEVIGGKPVRVRPVGEPWQATAQPRHATSQPRGMPTSASQPPTARPASDFVNSYNFLPAIPRDKVPSDSEFRDRTPVGHDRVRAGHFTGVISVTLTTVTPLLIPDAAQVSENGDGHKTFPVRLGVDGKTPCLAPTTVKGMLRAAYEAITNSRLGVFPGVLPVAPHEASAHGARLAFRLPAQTGLRTVPTRIVRGELGRLLLELLPGTSDVGPDGTPHNRGPMYAAWVKWYGWDDLHRPNERPSELRHGDPVWAYITPWQHDRPSFRFWNVEEIRFRNTDEPEPTTASDHHRDPWHKAHPSNWDSPRWVAGWLCKTERNIDNKHDERVFFSYAENRLVYPVDEHAEQWRQSIQNYQDIHQSKLNGGVTRPQALADYCRFSRHITHNLCEQAIAEMQLGEGTLCYAEVATEQNHLRILALYPVMISRKLFEKSPFESLHKSLHPAMNEKELSPVDRVFGWVPQKGKGGHRGQLRVGPVSLASPLESAIREFPRPGLPLPILGQPKPQQVRFYLGDANGRAQTAGQTKDQAGYDGTKQLRGRKVYPHHAKLPPDHWNPPIDGALNTSDPNVFREYLRHPNAEKRRDNQNRSILGWVNPGTTFSFDLHVTNLSKVELGALVWLLRLSKGQFHRLGLGKPLGFGSVQLKIDHVKTSVSDASEWKQFYGTLGATAPHTTDLHEAKSTFEKELNRAYGPEDADRILESFTAAAKGNSTLPIHYPRAGQPGQPVPPNPAGEGYEWFVANDAAGRRFTLPELTDNDPGLPTFG